MASIETIRRLTIEARTAGVEQAAARMADATRAISTMEGAVSRLSRAYDPLYTTTEKLTAASRTLALAVATGNKSQEEANRLYDQAVNKLTGLGRLKQEEARYEAKRREEIEKTARAEAQAYQASLNARLGIRAPTSDARDRGADMLALMEAAERLRAKYDPLFRAQQAYKTSLRELQEAAASTAGGQERYAAAIANLKTQFTEQMAAMGRSSTAMRERAAVAEQVRVQEEKLAAAAALVQSKWDALGRQGSRQLQLTDPNAAASARIASLSGPSPGSAAERRRTAAMLDPLTDAQQKRDERLEAAGRALKAGVLDQEQYTRSIAHTNTVYAAQERAIKKFTENTAAAGRAGRLSAYEYQNLGYQLNDVVASIGSGISPMQTLAQQGPQIFQILQGSDGGIRGAMKGIAEGAGTFAARMGLAGGAVAGVTLALGAGLVAWRSYANTQLEVERSLAGVGRGARTSVAQINEIAASSAEAGGVSVREARSMAAAFAGTGRIGADMFGQLITRTKDYARTTGQELPDAQKELAEAFADPGRGVEILTNKLGGLNDRTAQTIKRLKDQGDTLGAQRALFDALNANVTKSSELMSGWGRMMEAVGNQVSGIWDTLGQKIDRGLFGGTIDDQLAEAQRHLLAAREQSGSRIGQLFSGFNTREIAEAEKAVARLEALVNRRNKQNERVAQAREGREVMDLVRQLDPAQAELRQTEDRAEKLRKVISDPIKFGLDQGQLGQVQAAFERLSSLSKTMREDIEKYGSVAGGDMVRAAANANANVGLNPVDLSIQQEKDRLAASLRSKGLIDLPSREQAEADFTARAALADPTQQAVIQAERDARMRFIASRDAEVEATRLSIERIQKEAEVRARATAVEGDFISSMINHESGGRTNAKNPRSSATGLGQFIDETWLRLFRQNFADRAAGMSESQILGRRTDRDDSMALIRVYAAENKRVLERANVPTTNANQYMAWFAGAERAVRIAQADPNAPVSNFFSQKAINANPGLIAGRTVGQFRDWTERVMAKRRPGVYNTEQETDRLAGDVTTQERSIALTTARQKAQDLLNDSISRQSELGRAVKNVDELLAADMSKMSAEARAEAEAILASAKAYGERTAAIQNSALGRDIIFERAQIGRTPGEQQIASRLRGTGLGMDSAEAEGLRLNQTLTETRDLAKEAFSGFASDIRRGVTAAEALQNVFGRIVDKLMNSAIDKLIGGMFDTGSGGAGGGIGSIFSGVSKFFSGGFAEGGWTGYGGKYEPAGVVHRGEYVFDAASTARIGVSALEGIRAGLKGYADGGLVTDYALPPITGAPANVNNAPSFNATVVMQGSSGDPEQDARAAEMNAKAMRSEFDRMWEANAQRSMAPGGSLHAAGARRAR